MEILNNKVEPGVKGLLAPLLPWLSDSEVSEIMVNKPHEVFIEKRGEIHCFKVNELSLMHLKRLFIFISNETNQIISEESPLLSGNLYDGSRVQLVIPPASKHFALSIRRKSVIKKDINDYNASNFYQKARGFDIHASSENYYDENDNLLLSLYKQEDWANFMEKAVLFKKNIVISGETSSGKTTYLNALAACIPKEERIITLEDTYEVELSHPNQVNLCVTKPIDSFIQKVSMQDLVQCSLRLRPDRLLMGEIRGAEALDFISACSTGHEGSITTIHASNPKIAFLRMLQMVRLNNVPSMRDEDILRLLNEVIDVVVQLKPTPEGRVLQWVYYKGFKAFV